MGKSENLDVQRCPNHHVKQVQYGWDKIDLTRALAITGVHKHMQPH